ncbi:MAG TPA: alpha/beta hydrolase [Burkholderiales bacterium]|nr:alpha/beta hydrolase [Burkholderiales bacterium]
MGTIVLIFAVIAIAGPVLLSFAIEAMRRAPEAPAALPWALDLAQQYTTVDGIRLRYVRTGKGPPLVLLHTLRTQLDIFQKVIPELARNFTVYALDYPGHGWSAIPKTEYTPALFTDTVARFLDDQKIGNATLAGISIGGTIPLLLAARRHPGVTRVVSINPYDYGRGRGLARANAVAWLMFAAARVPVLGETFLRLRNPLVENIILRGGVAEAGALPESFLREMYAVGCRPGHYQAFLNLLRNAYKWDEARAEYGRISVPVLLVYGDRDWSREAERGAALARIPGARMETVRNGGHFLSLDRPQDVIRLIREFTKA